MITYRCLLLIVIVISIQYIVHALSSVPPILTPNFPIYNHGIHLTYSVEITRCKLPETYANYWIKYYQKTKKNYPNEGLAPHSIAANIDMYETLKSKSITTTDTVEYWGTDTGNLWVENSKRVAMAFNGSSYTICDPGQTKLNFPPLPNDAKSQEAFVVSDNNTTARLQPYLGFYQPNKEAFQCSNQKIDNNDSKSYISFYNGDYQDNFRYIFIIDNSERLQSVEFIKLFPREKYQFYNYQTIDNSLTIPSEVIWTSIGYHFIGKDTQNIKDYLVFDHDIRKYKLIDAEILTIDNTLFDVNSPPIGTYIQDDRYNVSYEYLSKDKTVEETSQIDQKRHRKPNANRLRVFVRFVSIGIFLIVFGLLLHRVSRKYRRIFKKSH